MNQNRAWNIAPPNAKNLSRKNFSSPYCEDRRPSAQCNYTTHGFKDYATREFSNTHAVAELLGFTPWDDYKAQHCTPLPRPASLAEKVSRDWWQGVPENLITLLLNLHGDTWLNVSRGVFNGFRGVKSVIVVGGGVEMVEPFLREWYGEKVIDRKKLPHTRRIHPVDMNAMGGLRLALMRQKQAT